MEKSSKSLSQAFQETNHVGRNQISCHLSLLICMFLTALPLLVYWQVQTYEFINMDDPLYVTENLKVRSGLTREGVVWAFAFNDISYWHPLTWLSHMVDCEIYWLNPQGHHFTNVLFHIANTLLLFLTLRTLTGALWRSAFVAAFFSLHPLNVESVAWVANRKNLVSAFFWILAMWSYAHYARKPNPTRYLMVFCSMLLGLLAKPTVATLPFVFLLLDFWPLDRYFPAVSNQALESQTRIESTGRLIIEKIPLMALSAASITISYMSSRQMGIIIPAEILPLGLRIQNALASYLIYIGKMLLPFDLAVFYPFAKTMPLWQIVTSCFVLLTVTALVVRFAKRKPYFTVGWFWYLGTLVPVIGLVQQGFWPAFADRFAYIPLIGLFIMTVWGISDYADRSRLSKILVYAGGSLAVLGMGMGAWVQTSYWKNSITLFSRAVAVTKSNHLAHYNLGVALHNSGKFNEGLLHCYEALHLTPDDEKLHNIIGLTLIHHGDPGKALFHIKEAIRLRPDYAEAYDNMGLALAKEGKPDEAIGYHLKAIEIDPNQADFHFHLGNQLNVLGNFDRAARSYSEALRIRPGDENAHLQKGYALVQQGKLEEALIHFDEVLRINPASAPARNNKRFVAERLRGKSHWQEP